MCFCEQDAVKVLVHVKVRKRYPGIRFHETALSEVVAAFGLSDTREVHALNVSDLQRLADGLLTRLPPSHRPARGAVHAA